MKVLKIMYDPIMLGTISEKYLIKKVKGKILKPYYRFRRDRWYGGVVTADVAGCNLRCKFCWAWRNAWTLKPIGLLLSPEDVAHKLISMARRFRIKQVRISGGEPTLGFEHILEVIDLVTKQGLHMILETNGILIGLNSHYAELLSQFRNRGIEIRVSIKGVNPEEFSLLTGAKPYAWYYQVKALENLIEYGLRVCDEVYPAVMLSFSDSKSYEKFKKVLATIDETLLKCIDEEYVIMYDHVRELLNRYELKPKKYFYPGNIPKEFI